ncbi:MAG: hypothetical protein M3R57_10950, partial [Chloroflexota bacterium]|nr:hypothetical protein [Chloroflexota bacterium]
MIENPVPGGHVDADPGEHGIPVLDLDLQRFERIGEPIAQATSDRDPVEIITPGRDLTRVRFREGGRRNGSRCGRLQAEPKGRHGAADRRGGSER